jgi:hypothetical protein
LGERMWLPQRGWGLSQKRASETFHFLDKLIGTISRSEA